MYDVGCNKTMLVICYSSALHLLARLQRTRSFGRQPYEDLVPNCNGHIGINSSIKWTEYGRQKE